MTEKDDNKASQEVLDFWFPEGFSFQIDANSHRDHWVWRMCGGAEGEIRDRFTKLTAEGAAGNLDNWASDSEGRLALIIVLDQFSRSVWRGSARAFAQDPAALALAVEGLSNGLYAALPTPWQKIVYGLPLGHCEGPDHLERIDLLIALREEIVLEAPAQLQPTYRSLVKQAGKVRKIIASFGRHPHRNQILGRQSTPTEKAYIAGGKFPHLQAFQA